MVMTIINLSLIVILVVVGFINLKISLSMKKMIEKMTIAGEEMFNDNELNTIFIQKALDMISEAGYEPDITVDNNGQRWISAKVGENASVNAIKLSKDLFKSKNFDPIKKIVENEINVVLPAFKKDLEEKENNKNA